LGGQRLEIAGVQAPVSAPPKSTGLDPVRPLPAVAAAVLPKPVKVKWVFPDPGILGKKVISWG
jgi:hypothetical protein